MKCCKHLTIRQKLYFSLVFTFFISFLLIFVIGNLYIELSFKESDEKLLQKEMNLASLIIGNFQDKIDSFVYDYAHWEETYKYTSNDNKEFVNRELLNNFTISSNYIDILQIISVNGDILFQYDYTILKTGIPKEFLTVNKQFINNKNDSSISGYYFVESRNEMYYIVSYPIVCPKHKEYPTKASLVGIGKLNWNKIFPRGFSLFDSTIDFQFKPPFDLKQNMKIQNTQGQLFSEYILKDVQDRPVGKIQLTKSFEIKNTLDSFFTLIMFIFLIVFIFFLTLLFYFFISIFRKINQVCLIIYEINNMGSLDEIENLNIQEKQCQFDNKNEFEFLDCQLYKMINKYFNKGRHI